MPREVSNHYRDATTNYAVYGEPPDLAAEIAKMVDLPIADRAPRPGPDGIYSTQLILIADSPLGVRRIADQVGSLPVAAIVAWRLPAEVARTLHRLPIPIFDGVPDPSDLHIALSGNWDRSGRRLENDRIAELEMLFEELAASGPISAIAGGPR